MDVRLSTEIQLGLQDKWQQFTLLVIVNASADRALRRWWTDLFIRRHHGSCNV